MRKVWLNNVVPNTDIERTQRVAIKIMTNGVYFYKEGLEELNLPTLKER